MHMGAIRKRLTKRASPFDTLGPSGWDTARFLELFYLRSFPFPVLVLLNRALKGHNARRWAAEEFTSRIVFLELSLSNGSL